MPEDLPAHSALLIVSDTAFYETSEGFAVFEPTLREIEQLLAVFPEITWIGAHHGTQKPANARLPQKKGIHFIPISRTGGDTWRHKLQILWHAPATFFTIWKAIHKARFIHTRSPATPAFMAMVLNHFYPRKRFWHKYAGNWVQENAPRGYTLQRWLLRRTKNSMVTVNGKWEKDPAHVYAFENPCFTQAELTHATNLAGRKVYTPPYRMLFAGRVELEKGVGILLEALSHFTPAQLPLEELVIAGTGKDELALKAQAARLPFNITFRGALSRTDLETAYAQSQFFLFPSYASEGFPKVVAEAAAFGCILITSPVSSLVQYVKHESSGLVIDPIDAEALQQILQNLAAGIYNLPALAHAGAAMAPLFTYERYNERIRSLFLNGEAN